MYLNKILIENSGPIEKIEITANDLFHENGNPKIILLIGANGSGKTILMSSLVDSFFELGRQYFRNIEKNELKSGGYFKLLGGLNQKRHSWCSLTYIQFILKKYQEKYEYIEKTGTVDLEEIRKKTNTLLELNEEPEGSGVFKESTQIYKNKKFQEDFSENIHCFFSAERFELPHWINKDGDYKEKELYKYDLDKKIFIKNSLDEIQRWILNLFLESGVRIEDVNSFREFNKYQNHKLKFKLTKRIQILENILSKILKRQIKLAIDSLKRFNRYLKIIDKHTGIVILERLSQLSMGESTLFSMFATIIKQSTDEIVWKSKQLSTVESVEGVEGVEGIVLIDEIDLHLHIELQKDVLPELISLFPKIQFIISTHSPFFLYGMNEELKEKLSIIQMPSGIVLDDFENFSEFKNAYDIFKKLSSNNKTQLDQLKKEVEEAKKPIVFCEGSSDVQYMEKAMEIFQIKINCDFKSIGEKGKNKRCNFGGKSNLEKLIFLLENKKIVLLAKVMFLFDHDVSKDKNFEKINENNKIFVKILNQNEENKIEEKGIENLFPQKTIKRIKNECKGKKIGENYKKYLQESICKSGTKEDFINFKTLLKEIKKVLEN